MDWFLYDIGLRRERVNGKVYFQTFTGKGGLNILVNFFTSQFINRSYKTFDSQDCLNVERKMVKILIGSVTGNLSQQTITCSKSTIETIKKEVK